MRGEYVSRCTAHRLHPELPPRARRILRIAATARPSLGTTSACAENTPGRKNPYRPGRNYLRVRGEYYEPARPYAFEWELPPRARRIRCLSYANRYAKGTTSACAENTARNRRFSSRFWNYLRVRGEYDDPMSFTNLVGELPPRARRIQLHHTSS